MQPTLLKMWFHIIKPGRKQICYKALKSLKDIKCTCNSAWFQTSIVEHAVVLVPINSVQMKKYVFLNTYFYKGTKWPWLMVSPRRYVLKIHFFIELDLKMIQFKIKFKTNSGIFIQKNIHSIEFRIFNRIIHSKKMRKIIQNSKIRPNMASEPSWDPCIGNRNPEMD